MTSAYPREPGLPTIDMLEYGGKRDGVRQSMDRRLFMQLLVVDVPSGHASDHLAKVLAVRCAKGGIAAVIYTATMPPNLVALLPLLAPPALFVHPVTPLF